jgi:hypothetical protein
MPQSGVASRREVTRRVHPLRSKAWGADDDADPNVVPGDVILRDGAMTIGSPRFANS